MNRFKALFLLLGILALSSCVSKKKIIYFQDTTNVEKISDHQSFALTLKKDDLLNINVTALDLEAVKPFNLPSVAYDVSTNAVTGVPRQQLYLIDSEGFIEFPVLGKLKVAGLTRNQTIDMLRSKLSKYITNPTINIQIANFRVSVLGDVKRPGTFSIQNEKISILEAIALAGDLNISGEREITVVRETSKGKISAKMDLKSNTLFHSPYYYLQQNDVVYVAPNTAKVQSASYNQNTGLFISVASVLISLITVITR